MSRLRHCDEIGDTLIEVLIAVVIISLSAVALLGTLTTTITASAEHRSYATLDTVLKNFAEAAKYDIQLQPASTALYRDCADQQNPTSTPTYQVASVYPTTAAIGTGVTVFGTGFHPGNPVTAKIGAVSVPNAATVKPDGTISASFALPPSVASGAQAVSVTDGVSTTAAPSALQVTPSTGSSAASPVQGFSLAISSIGWWNSTGSKWDDSSTASCSAVDKSGIQMLNLVATTPTHLNDSLSVVVVNPAIERPNPAPTLTVTSNAPQAGQAINFSARLQGSTGGSAPTCVIAANPCVTWTITNAPGNPTACPSSTLTSSGNISTATPGCTVASALPGVYQVTVQYGGDANYSPTVGYGSVTIALVNPTLTINAAPSLAVAGQTLDFGATVTGSGGVVPTGTVSWAFTGVPAGAVTPTCNPSTLAANGPASSTTPPAPLDCEVANAKAGTYTVQGTYTPDVIAGAYYASVTSTKSITVNNPFIITNVKLANGGSTAGKIESGDSIAVSFSGPIQESSVCSNWTGTGNQTITTNGAVVVTVNDGTGLTNDTITASVATGSCGTFNFGSINLGSAAYASGGNSTFSGNGGNRSTLAWNSTTNTLTITLGGKGGSGALAMVATSTPVYTAAPGITSSTAIPISNSPFTLPQGVQF